MIKKKAVLGLALALVFLGGIAPASNAVISMECIDQPAAAVAIWVGDENQKDKEEGKIAKPVVLQKVDPKYPPEAKKEKVSGDVLLDVTIGKDGVVLDAKASNEADPRLVQAAIEAVKQWKYKPAMDQSGKPVEVKATITIRFKLK